jgi:predicted AlkP superfamily phosphohydrolase/phosphomutase
MSNRQRRVVMLGFDAMDPVITERMAAAGRLPAFRELLESAARRSIRNPPGLFVGSLWSTFFTGRSAVQTGFHCWEEIVAGEYERRLTTAASIRGQPFWETLSDAGKRIAVLDVPHSRAGSPINGVQVSEWGCHDRHFGFRTHPPELTQEIIDRFGLHPLLTADPFSIREWAPDDYMFRDGALRTGAEEQALLAALLAGADAKRRLSVDILKDGPWDLYVSIFGEPHSVGHQSWHLHDTSHPRHHPSVRARIGDPLTQVYEKMDEALAEVLAQVDDETIVLVLLSHGMGPHFDGTHLLPEMLRHLDAAYRSPPERSITGRTLGWVWLRMPASLREATRKSLAALLRTRLRRRQLQPPRDHDTDDERRAQAFFLSPNNFVVGGVRINLQGREADGRVRPGPELEAVCSRLEADLLALVNVEYGTSVINRVERSDAHYDRESLDAIPDLFLEWNHDHPIETVWSPRFGMIRGPYTHWRTGDHRPGGLLLVQGPGLVHGAELPPLEMHDLASLIMGELGVAPADVDALGGLWRNANGMSPSLSLFQNPAEIASSNPN